MSTLSVAYKSITIRKILQHIQDEVFYFVLVISKEQLPKPTAGSSEEELFSSKNHNYTDCCMAKNVMSNCLGFCNIQSILEGSFPQIYYLRVVFDDSSFCTSYNKRLAIIGMLTFV